MLLEDAEVREKLATQNRERIPERIVHAKGAVAKGYFEVSLQAMLPWNLAITKRRSE